MFGWLVKALLLAVLFTLVVGLGTTFVVAKFAEGDDDHIRHDRLIRMAHEPAFVPGWYGSVCWEGSQKKRPTICSIDHMSTMNLN